MTATTDVVDQAVADALTAAAAADESTAVAAIAGADPEPTDPVERRRLGLPWITEPGIYEMTAEEYHADPVVGGSLSSTGLRKLAPPNPPALFRHYRDHEAAETPALTLGKAAHAVVLGIGDPIGVVYAKDWRTTKAKDARAELVAAGCIALLEHEVDQVHAMAARLRAHEVAGPLLARPGRAEMVLVWRDPLTGVFLRVMTDWTPDPLGESDPFVMVDYKTTAKASREKFARSMADFGYHAQAAHYLAGAHACGLVGARPSEFVFIAQEKEAPYMVNVVPVGPNALTWGSIENAKALDTYLACTAADRWPDYISADGRLEPLELPEFSVRERERRDAAGGYDLSALTAATIPTQAEEAQR